MKNLMNLNHIFTFIFCGLWVVPSLRAQGKPKLLHIIKHKHVQCLTISPDNRYIATGGGKFLEGGKGNLRIWDLESGDLLYKKNWKLGHISALAYTPDGNTLLMSMDSGKLIALDILSQEIIYILDVGISGADEIVCTPNGRFTYDYLDDILVRDTKTGKKIKEIDPDMSVVDAFDIHPNATVLVIAKDDSLPDFSTVTIWDLEKEEEIQKIEKLRGSLDGIAISKDNLLAFSGDDEGTVLWDLNSNQFIRHIPDDSFDLHFSPDGSYLLLTYGYSLYLYNQQGEEYRELPHNRGVYDFAVTSDNKHVASISFTNHLFIWSLE